MDNGQPDRLTTNTFIAGLPMQLRLSIFSISGKVLPRLCHFLLCILVLAVQSCATTDDTDKPAIAYFSTAMEHMDDRDFVLAIEQFEQLNAIYPFSEYAEQSLLELAYAYHFNGDDERARATINRFIRQHPESEQYDYVLYLRGVINFEEDRNLLHNGLGLNPAQRSLQGGKIAIADFSELIRLFPQSRFAPDARKYIVYIRNQLALKEILIGEFYLTRNAGIAALNRGQEVLKQYASTVHIARAMDLIYRSYQQMGMRTQAAQTRAKIARYYPDYQLIGDSL